MTLGRLMELYHAEQQGKQIMVRKYHCGYYSTYKIIEEVKISDCDLSTIVKSDNEDEYEYTYFIKDEEDEYGY